MEDIFYRQMPHSLEAEQSVLGSMLIDANCVKDVMEQLRPDDFYLKQNREIFETIYSMFVYSKPIDGVTVAGEMEKNGTYEESTTRPYLAQLMDVTPTSANVMEYVGIVRDKALLRALYTVAGEISTMVQDGTGGASSVLDAAEQKIYAVRRGRSAQSMASIGVVLQGVLDHLSELSANGGKTLPGLPTGFGVLDDKMNGLNKSDLVLLAARPGMGKTSMALNLALNVARSSGQAVAVFSLEKDGHFFPVGTINIMISLNISLPSAIMTRAIITITEGKTAALQDLGIADVNNGLPATGTGTDGITLITNPDAPRYTDAGTFSVLGSLLASAAYETVRECLELYDKPWNRDDSLATPPAVDLSRLRNKECGH